MDDKNNFIQGKTGDWEIVIGLEVHAQVISRSKLFSGAPTVFGAMPNEQVSFVDAGMPGMLPVLNHFCVDQAIKTGLGLHGKINLKSVFDRKNYFYPDLPTGYQISQFHHPIVTNGHVDIDLPDGSNKRIRINRLHLEQDAGKSVHDLHPSKSYIDLNRCGIALMEIVTEPDMRSIAEAQAYVKKLRALLRYLGTCDGNMEEGSLRVDTNISLCRPGSPWGTRVEIKNINSVRFVGLALEYEIGRQLDVLESGGIIIQETRLFDPSKGETRSMRSKEDAHDYRYFPDPDLPPLLLSEERVEKIQQDMPELPDAKKERFMMQHGLSSYDASCLSEELELSKYYEDCLGSSAFFRSDATKEKASKSVANWIMGELFSALNRHSMDITRSPVSSAHMAALVDLILDETISGKIAKDLFLKIWETGDSPINLVESLGLKQNSDEGEILTIIQGILDQHKDKVEEYRSGKDKLFGFFVGQVMKAMQGKGNPALINQILQKALSSGG